MSAYFTIDLINHAITAPISFAELSFIPHKLSIWYYIGPEIGYATIPGRGERGVPIGKGPFIGPNSKRLTALITYSFHVPNCLKYIYTCKLTC